MIAVPVLTFFMIFILMTTEAQSVTQPEDKIYVSEGSPVEVKCTYSYSGVPELFWYVWYPNQRLQVLLKQISRESNKGFQANLNKAESSYHLRKLHVEEKDSAVYFCALRRGTDKLTFGKGTRVIIKPIIKDPEPALYQLRSPKSSDLSVCLFTDFDSNKSIKDANTNASDPTVLEMMTMESKSYGAVAWGDKSNMDCTKAFQQNMVNFTQVSGSTCKVKDVKQGFETDKDLNTMNMILIVVRITFLKAVGFNLLMTLRLWSN